MNIEELTKKFCSKDYDGKGFTDDLRKVFFELSEIEHNHVFKLAWEKGHSSGYHEVYLYYWDIFDMIQAIKNDTKAQAGKTSTQ